MKTIYLVVIDEIDNFDIIACFEKEETAQILVDKHNLVSLNKFEINEIDVNSESDIESKINVLL